MTKKISLLVLIIAIYGNVLAQKQMRFKVAYQPGKTYTTEMKMDSQSEMNFEGDEQMIEQIKSSGMSLPMLVEMQQLMNLKTITGANKNDKGLPVTITYDKVEMKQIMNGQEHNVPNELQNMRIEGWINATNQIQIDSIHGNVKADMRNLLGAMLKEMQKQITFPDRDMKIGDTFSEKTPLDIPLGGGAQMKIAVTTTYTLKEIQKPHAKFDLAQVFTLDMSTGEQTGTATGQGTGNLVYDLNENFITSYVSDVDMNLKMQINTLTMIAKNKTKVDQKISIH